MAIREQEAQNYRLQQASLGVLRSMPLEDAFLLDARQQSLVQREAVSLVRRLPLPNSTMFLAELLAHRVQEAYPLQELVNDWLEAVYESHEQVSRIRQSKRRSLVLRPSGSDYFMLWKNVIHLRVHRFNEALIMSQVPLQVRSYMDIFVLSPRYNPGDSFELMNWALSSFFFKEPQARSLVRASSGAYIDDRGRLRTLFSPVERRVLMLFARNPLKTVLSHGEIIEAIKDHDGSGLFPEDVVAIRVHTKSLRGKLALLFPDGPKIETVHGVGYRLVPGI